MTKISRRKFLTTTGGAAAVLASAKMPAIAQGTPEVHILRWNDFVPACDTYLRTKLFPEAEKALGIKVKFETVNANDLQARITSGIQAGAGPDVIMLNNNHPHLYKASLVDVSDVAADVSKAPGRMVQGRIGQRLVGRPVLRRADELCRRLERLARVDVQGHRADRIPQDLGRLS